MFVSNKVDWSFSQDHSNPVSVFTLVSKFASYFICGLGPLVCCPKKETVVKVNVFSSRGNFLVPPAGV